MAKLSGEAWLRSPQRRKRDVLYMTALLPAVAPLAVAGLALAHFVDGKGPDGEGGLFVQERLGRDRQKFEIYKTRTQLVPGSGTPTRIGRVLRFCSIDELPQAYNVLQGDLALFGPRALMEKELEEMRQTLPRTTFDEWEEAYSISGPGCISSFGHESHKRGAAWNREEFFIQRAALDIHDFQSASPAHDRHLLMQVGVTAAHMLLHPGQAKY
jgi:lipopolysaccharide/colanic/teichoic acid biosynthesis glycosyltransferase